MTNITERMKKYAEHCPFYIGDKVKVISPLYKEDWSEAECYVVGIRLKGDNFNTLDISIVENGVAGITDGWSVHELKCIERSNATMSALEVAKEALGSIWFSEYNLSTDCADGKKIYDTLKTINQILGEKE